MKALKLALLAAVGALALGGTAYAQEAEAGPVKLSFNVGASNDYVFRGVSQTDERPQVFGGVDATIGAIGYAGVWLSNVDFLDSTNMEYDLYGGVKPVLGAVTLDLGLIRYGYTDQPRGADYDNWEVKVGGSIPAGKATLGAAVYYSPDGFGAAEASTYYEVNAAAPLNDIFSVSGALGRQTYEGSGDYTTWNVGVGWAFAPHFALDLRYWDTSEHDFGEIYESRAVATVKASF